MLVLYPADPHQRGARVFSKHIKNGAVDSA